MDKKEKKIRIHQIREKQEVKTAPRQEALAKEEIKGFYDQEEISCLERPSSGLAVWTIIAVSLIFSLVGSFIFCFFILTRENVKLPFIGELSINKIFPTREITVVREKNVTVTNDLRLIDLAKKIKPQLMKI